MNLQGVFVGVLLGFSFGVLLIVMILRWAFRNKELLRELIREIYHIDLMPFIARIEGSLNVALAESKDKDSSTFIQIAIDQVLLLKKQILNAVKKYEDYQ